MGLRDWIKQESPDDFDKRLARALPPTTVRRQPSRITGELRADMEARELNARYTNAHEIVRKAAALAKATDDAIEHGGRDNPETALMLREILRNLNAGLHGEIRKYVENEAEAPARESNVWFQNARREVRDKL